MEARRRYTAAMVAAYLCFGMGWILLSDALLAQLLSPERIQQLSTLKGLFFIALTAALLGLALYFAPGPREAGAGSEPGPAPPVLALAAALLLPLLALLLRDQLIAQVPPRPLLLIFMLPITVAALLGGLLPGLLATATSGLLVLPTGLGDQAVDRLQWGLLLLNGVVVSGLSAALLRGLREQRRHLHLIDAIIEHSPDAIWVRDAQGRVLLANAAAQGLEGQTLAQVGLGPLERRAWDAGALLNLEQTRQLRDGPTHHLQISVGPIPDGRGAQLGVFTIARDVSELRDSLEVLAASQAALAEAQRVAELGSWEQQLPDGALECSAELLRLLGLAQAPHRLEGLAEALGPQAWAQLAPQLEQARQSCGELAFDLELPGGRWLAARGRVELGVDGRPCRLAGTLQDISARKQAEQALAEREQQLRRVLEGADQGYWDWNLQTQDFQVSANLERLLGRPAAQCGPAHWADFVHADDLREALGSVQRHLSGQSPLHQAELRCRVPDRGWRRLSVRGRVVARDEQGRARTMSGTFVDITERHELELALREAQTVFERSEEGIVFCDAELRITKVNPAVCAITGYSAEEVLGQTPRLFSSGRHDRAFYAALWENLLAQGRWRGEIWNKRKNGEVYAEMLSISMVRDAQGRPLHYIGVFTDISPLKAHAEELERLLHYDPLTGLANRRLLTDRLQQAIARARRGGHGLAVCLLDLDGFAAVNAARGEAAGNQLLVGVAAHLQAALRAEDTLARLGGDEFALLLSELGAGPELMQALERVLQAVRRPVRVDGQELRISASVGVTRFPQDPADADTLLRHADQAMLLAKGAGRDRYQLFDPEAERAARLQRDELECLRRALRGGEFELFYQPKVDLQLDGRVLGVEALIRWRDPRRGLIPPADFLPHLPGTELELEIGNWVMRTAWERAAAWHEAGHALLVSVNISAHQLLAPGFAEGLRELLRAHPELPPGLLELEVLESAAIHDMQQAIAVMRDCRALGLRFALDDFGTGYSSLSYLRQLPIDCLKIDQSFVFNMLERRSDRGIVGAVLGLAQAFELQVVAEGVETLAHAAELRRMGCRGAQGYGIARPMPVNEFERWLSAWPGLQPG